MALSYTIRVHAIPLTDATGTRSCTVTRRRSPRRSRPSTRSSSRLASGSPSMPPRTGTRGATRRLWVGDDWDGFEHKWQELSGNGLRLIDFETWLDGPVRRYAGVFEEGNDQHSDRRSNSKGVRPCARL